MAQRRSGRSVDARRVSARVSRRDLLTGLRLADGPTVTADACVFACGPCVPKVFPDLLKGPIQPTGQEVFFFGTPSGDGRFSEGTMPVWVDFGPRLFCGIPGNEGRGLKVGDDSRGEPFDPTGSTPEIDS